MTWTRTSDDFPQRPNVMSLSDAAYRMHSTAMAWSNQQLTDGRIPKHMVALCALPHNAERANELAGELETAGLWADEGEYWQLDWSDQPSAEQVNAARAASAARKRKWESVKAKHSAGDHSACNPNRCQALLKDRNAVTNAVTNGVSNAGVTRPSPSPIPSHPIPSHKRWDGDGEGDAGRGAGSADPTPLWHTYTPQHHPTQDQLRDGTPAERLHLGWPFDPDKPWLGGHEDNGRIWRTWQMAPWSPHNPDRPQTKSET